MTLAYTPPTGWGFPTIEELASPEKSAIRIGPFGSALKKHEYSESGVRVLGIEDVFPNKLVSDNPKYIPRLKYRELSQYTVKPDDILITNMGTVGRTCVVPADLENSIISSHLIKVSLDLRAAWPLYISWMLNFCPLVISQIRSKSHGAIMAGFNTSLLKQLRIPLPPLPEQRRIAEILDRAEALRAKRRVALAQLDALTQTIFLDLFGDPARNSKGWPLIALGDVAREKPNNGIFRKNPEYEQDDTKGLPVVWVEELFRGNSIDTKESRRVVPTKVEASKYGLHYGDVLFCRSSLKLDGIAFNNVYLGQDNAALFECHLIRVQPNLNIASPIYLNSLLRLPQMRAIAKSKSKTATMTTIDQTSLCSIPVILPPFSLQQKFTRRITAVEKLKTTHRASLAEMDALFSSLQHRAFRGEL